LIAKYIIKEIHSAKQDNPKGCYISVVATVLINGNEERVKPVFADWEQLNLIKKRGWYNG